MTQNYVRQPHSEDQSHYYLLIPGFLIHALIQIKILKSLLNWTESWGILTNIIKYMQINFKEDSFKINC